MPSWLSEGNVSRSTDNEIRSLEKWADLLYQSVGNVASLPFPEGSKPLPSDNEQRLIVKIEAMS